MHSQGEPPLTRVMIKSVAEGSQGEQVGVAVGDVMAEVDGVGVRGMPWAHISKEALNEILTDPEPASDCVTVAFLRRKDAGGGSDPAGSGGEGAAEGALQRALDGGFQRLLHVRR